MQMVIKISEDDYKEVLKDAYSGTPFENRVFSAIQNGILLPEPHGRISDVGKVEKRILEYMDKHKDERGDGAYAALIMLNVETIVPATNAWTPKKD